MQKFVVLGVQRTGTTLIRTTLSSHPGIYCVGEAFKMRTWFRGKDYPGEHGYPWYLAKSPVRKLKHYIVRSDNARSYLEHLYSLPGYEAVGFKFMMSHSRRFSAVVPYIKENNVKIIRVVRRNALKTLVSRLSAQARGKHHSTKKLAVTKITIPVRDLDERLERIIAGSEQWAEMFSDQERLEIVYEDFVKDSENQGQHMLEYIGVEAAAISSPLVKLNPDSLSEVIENYSEVEHCLKGTRFEEFLS